MTRTLSFAAAIAVLALAVHAGRQHRRQLRRELLRRKPPTPPPEFMFRAETTLGQVLHDRTLERQRLMEVPRG